MAKQVIQTADKVLEATNNYAKGYKIKGDDNPFFDINKFGTSCRKANVNYKMTLEETKEYIRASKSVIYFAQKYCKVKNEESKVELIPLRDYQYDVLNMFANNNRNILMASRQTGKCVTGDTIVNYNGEDIMIYELYYNNIEKPTILDKIKLYLYKIIKLL